MMQNKVFARTDAESSGTRISSNTYNLIIGLVLVWGFFINYLIVKNVPVTVLSHIHPIILLILYFGLCFGGIYIFTKSDNPLISFFGYNMVVIPFGFILNLIISRYDPNIVIQAMQITGMVTLLMMLLGSIYPAFFKRIAGALFIALISVIIVELIGVLIFKWHHGIIDWIVALIFCGYIGYDWARAQSIPKTVDNAVDSAASLYMDIINLFIRILRILGGRR